MPDKWGFIRQIYMEYLPIIIAQGKGPYSHFPILDWVEHMNECENEVWTSLRNSHAVLYPQYPVFNYFIDFANPCLRIGLEVDGKQHDIIKDRGRDELLAHINWKIYRITAQEVYSKSNFYPNQSGFSLDDPQLEDDIREWLLESAAGVVKALEWVYFTPNDSFTDNEHDRNLYAWAIESLNKHRLVDFPIIGCNFT